MWSKEDIDEWITVLRHVCAEACQQPELVRSAPHNRVTHRVVRTRLDDADYWATTWRAYQRKRWQRLRWPHRRVNLRCGALR